MGYVLGANGSVEKNPTVVYGSWLAADGTPAISPFTKTIFEDAAVNLIVTGHQPHGDAPLPISVDSDKLIVTGDTSYSGDTKWEESLHPLRRSRGRDGSLSGRGQVAVSEVLIELDGDDLLSVRSRGVLSDGLEYDTELWGDETAAAMGTEVEVDGKKWWVKADLGDGQFLGARAEGWSITNTILTDIN